MKRKSNKSILDNTVQEPKLKEEWTSLDFTRIKQKICLHFQKPYKMVCSWLGLVYTSTSAYAGLWVCNKDEPHKKYKGFRYYGFAISEDGKSFYSVLKSTDETYMYVKL